MTVSSTAQILDSFGRGDSRVELVDLGRIEYSAAWEIQKELVTKRIEGSVCDTLLLCEHDPVITLGRGSQREATPFLDSTDFPTQIPVLEIERGGLATYHGPGQLVAYPIFQLARSSNSWARGGVVNLIRSLEFWIMDYLASQGLQSKAICEKTGVWVVSKSLALMERESAEKCQSPNERKIASIGIAVKRWVSYHGLAFNFDTGPDPWRVIRPCGFQANVMTDLSRELGRHLDYETVKNELLLNFWKHFSSAKISRGTDAPDCRL